MRIDTVGPRSARSNEKPLCCNLYDSAILGVVWSNITDTTCGLEATYVTSVRAAKVEQPDGRCPLAIMNR